jgi:hypothetical protein
MNPKKLVIILLFIIVIAGIVVFIQRQKGTAIQDLQTNVPIEILESTNLNTEEPQFQLNVISHGDLSSNPHKILLKNLETSKIELELPLSESVDANECSPHGEMMGTMKKWNTEWFTVPNMKDIDNQYTSKLANTYSVEVIYQNGGTQKLLMSVHTIGGVCYQIPKAVPMTPIPSEEKEE